MHTSENKTKDDGLIGNEQIEEAIAALQQKPSEELLAHALTVVRSRMREKGQVILAVDIYVSGRSGADIQDCTDSTGN